MEPRIDVITLAVDDLERALVFYRDGLGLDSPGVVGAEFPGDDESPVKRNARVLRQLRPRVDGQDEVRPPAPNIATAPADGGPGIRLGSSARAMRMLEPSPCRTRQRGSRLRKGERFSGSWVAAISTRRSRLAP
jgi:hypothetical protein